MTRERRTYIANDLLFACQPQGYVCTRTALNRMCQDILQHGKITDVHHHSAHSIDPDGTERRFDWGTQALTVVCDHVPHISYTIHLSGFRVSHIIEETM